MWYNKPFLFKNKKIKKINLKVFEPPKYKIKKKIMSDYFVLCYGNAGDV